VAFLEGPPQTRLFGPLVEFLRQRGVKVQFDSKISKMVFDEANGLVTGLELADGTVETADIYISAMPLHNLWRVLPEELRKREPFSGLRHLHGVPVMTVQLYFDRPVTGVDNLIFSSRSHISVYAELGQICADLRRPGRSMVELVVAPAAEWFKLSDQQVVEHVMKEFATRHPAVGGAILLKSTVVRIPQSVYRARPGLERFRPDQQTSVSNLYLCGDFTRQNYLASMEGAVLSGKLVADKIANDFTSLTQEDAVAV
jgi:uncharacterized protein with NAD-binding domain and iron-sulfur cluster